MAKAAKDAKGGKAAKTPAKAQKASAAKSGGKQKKKKWSKGKMREKVANLVLLDKATQDKLESEVPTYKLITPSVVSERLKLNGSLARRSLRDLERKGLIRAIIKHSTQMIYTRVPPKIEEKPAVLKTDAKIAATPAPTDAKTPAATTTTTATTAATTTTTPAVKTTTATSTDANKTNAKATPKATPKKAEAKK
eukprot:TRINITY_DN221_c0_g1_i2.p1 TRINITY_DN221_c0_g1~~TRINITY_DN221_c0_g1_i2.p1  ORF type:complete len:194 (-),score=95.58 TRINITY_DN221_c0_g1_i2:190-771(-)